LLRETAALAEIGPPHVPAVFASRRLADGTPYLVMELLRIPTLAQHLDEAAGPIPIERWVSMARIVMEALGAVHSRGFVHADLKPENIFLAPNLTRACLVDFGLAASASSSAASLMEREGVAIVGSVEYMSPEQCEGRTDLDERADLYALGVVFYELLTARVP